MKLLQCLMMFAMVGFFASCKDSSAAKEEAKESLAAAAAPSHNAAPTHNGAAMANNEPAIPAGPLTALNFPKTEFDFGEIKEGEKVEHVFKFKNTGDEPLIISNAKGSCGCTVPEWPREPIAPGKEGEIKVVYNSTGKGSVEGRAESKRVTITANTDPANSYLNIKGKVFKEAGAAAPAAGHSGM